MKVTHRSSRVTQATDFYAWGNVMRENKSPEDARYRYGYQGQFSERDEETGYNFFELRNYDPIVGRWISPDPYAQYWSPYAGIGNDPIGGIDQDGGFKTKFGAQWYSFWNGGAVEQAVGGHKAGEWFVGKQVELEGGGAGIQFNRAFDWGFDVSGRVAGELSLGVQAGYHITGVPGADFNLFSFTFAEIDIDFRYTSQDGFTLNNKDVFRHIFQDDFDPKIQQFATGDIPFIGGSLARSFRANDEYNTSDKLVNLHVGHPVGAGNYELHWGYSERKADEKYFGGSRGARAIIGGDVIYKFKINK